VESYRAHKHLGARLGRNQVNPSKERLLAVSEITGFRANVIEKAARLLNLLTEIQSHPHLKGRLALKGGTALNLFLWDMPRLSVDIDLNYIGSPDRDTMLSERREIEDSLQGVFSRQGLNVRRTPTEHAGGKWILRHESAMGGMGNLELDLNYMYRIPLWPVEEYDSRKLGPFQAKDIPIVDVHELFAGKLVALLARDASRDLFDVHQILKLHTWEIDRLRLGFVLLGAMNRKDWRYVSVKDISVNQNELERDLVPVLRSKILEGVRDVGLWASRIVDETKDAFGRLLPLRGHEVEFLDRLLDQGEIHAELLTDDPGMRELIFRHPLLRWKALNVTKRP